ncbi:cytochrome P450 [Herbiconiux liukaitaii]|uniref:cytochrome P450 n=1 Tax=Herbiconiux liukaitaii TaxID=3342799 RepID=UPI0035B846F2
MSALTAVPAESDIDLFSAETVADPFSALDVLREAAPVVHMTGPDFWLLTRYADVRAAAADWETFSSAQGVALTPQFNANIAGSVLATDPPEHDQLRAVLASKLAPRGLAVVREQISTYARQLVGQLVERGSFDGVVDVARVFPINVVGDLVGLPYEGRERLHPGADATFAGFGPFTPYVLERLPLLEEYHKWMGTMADRSKLRPGGWGEAVMDAVDDGRLSMLGAVRTMSAYLTAGMDTTVNAIAAMMRLFADRPDVWEAFRANRKLAGPIFEEILRLESPVTGFFRVTTRDVDYDGVVVPAGARIMLHWAAANRDPRHYANPSAFEIDRNPLDHLAFGYGTHACAGQGLARLEVVTLLEAFAERVERFTLTGPVERRLNPIVRSLESVPLAVTVA